MDINMIKRYFTVNEQLKELQEERDTLNKEIKHFMISHGINKATIGNYDVVISEQDRSKYDPAIVDYLKEIGMSDLVIETYDEKQLKTRCNHMELDVNILNRYKVDNIIHVLQISPAKPE